MSQPHHATAIFLARIWHEGGQEFRARVIRSLDISADPPVDSITAYPAELRAEFDGWLRSALESKEARPDLDRDDPGAEDSSPGYDGLL